MKVIPEKGGTVVSACCGMGHPRSALFAAIRAILAIW
jgi:hypothetical protein